MTVAVASESTWLQSPRGFRRVALRLQPIICEVDLLFLCLSPSLPHP